MAHRFRRSMDSPCRSRISTASPGKASKAMPTAPTSNPSKEPHNTVHRNMALRKASRPRKARISLR